MLFQRINTSITADKIAAMITMPKLPFQWQHVPGSSKISGASACPNP